MPARAGPARIPTPRHAAIGLRNRAANDAAVVIIMDLAARTANVADPSRMASAPARASKVNPPNAAGAADPAAVASMTNVQNSRNVRNAASVCACWDGANCRS